MRRGQSTITEIADRTFRCLCHPKIPVTGSTHYPECPVRYRRQALLLAQRVMQRCEDIAYRYPERDPAEDGNGYWAAAEITKQIRKLAEKKA